MPMVFPSIIFTLHLCVCVQRLHAELLSAQTSVKDAEQISQELQEVMSAPCHSMHVGLGGSEASSL